jgi:hypothetical protein
MQATTATYLPGAAADPLVERLGVPLVVAEQIIGDAHALRTPLLDFSPTVGNYKRGKRTKKRTPKLAARI